MINLIKSLEKYLNNYREKIYYKELLNSIDKNEKRRKNNRGRLFY